MCGNLLQGLKLFMSGTKGIFKNETDEEGELIQNKSRLVAQGYIQVEGVDFD